MRTDPASASPELRRQDLTEQRTERARIRLRGRDFLSASGYTTIEAVDGVESVAKAASERPDLVLMVIQVPVLDGYYAMRQIKALVCLAGPHSRRHVNGMNFSFGSRTVTKQA